MSARAGTVFKQTVPMYLPRTAGDLSFIKGIVIRCDRRGQRCAGWSETDQVSADSVVSRAKGRRKFLRLYCDVKERSRIRYGGVSGFHYLCKCRELT